MPFFSPVEVIGITTLIIKDLNTLIRKLFKASSRFTRAQQLYVSLAENAQDYCDDIHQIATILRRMRDQNQLGIREVKRIGKKLAKVGNAVREVLQHADDMLAREDIAQRFRAAFGRKLREMETRLKEVRKELGLVEGTVVGYRISHLENSVEDVNLSLKRQRASIELQRSSIDLQRRSIDQTHQVIRDVRASMECLQDSVREMQLVPRYYPNAITTVSQANNMPGNQMIYYNHNHNQELGEYVHQNQHGGSQMIYYNHDQEVGHDLHQSRHRAWNDRHHDVEPSLYSVSSRTRRKSTGKRILLGAAATGAFAWAMMRRRASSRR